MPGYDGIGAIEKVGGRGNGSDNPMANKNYL